MNWMTHRQWSGNFQTCKSNVQKPQARMRLDLFHLAFHFFCHVVALIFVLLPIFAINIWINKRSPKNVSLTCINTLLSPRSFIFTVPVNRLIMIINNKILSKKNWTYWIKIVDKISRRKENFHPRCTKSLHKFPCQGPTTRNKKNRPHKVEINIHNPTVF